MSEPTKEPVIYVCSFPEMAPSLNEYDRMHWAKRDRQREKFQEVYWAELNRDGNKCPRGFERVEIHAVLMYPTHRRRDSDNQAPLKKWFQDSLVSLRIIPDDTADRCHFHTPRIMTGAEPMTVITIEGWHTPPEEGGSS
ncbi:MAG: hypothetical protein JW990_00235 [Thermoleophilia bacterium]|nr:hypothetical protein [Thermoleophilia bacterium]